MNLKKYAPLSLLPVAGFAFATDPAYVTAVTDAITLATASIATVGAAVLVMLVGAKVFKWIRRAF